MGSPVVPDVKNICTGSGLMISDSFCVVEEITCDKSVSNNEKSYHKNIMIDY